MSIKDLSSTVWSGDSKVIVSDVVLMSDIILRFLFRISISGNMVRLEEVYEKVNKKAYPAFQYFAIFVISCTTITNGGIPLFLTFLTSTKGWQCRTDKCNASLSLCEQELGDDDWFSPVSPATDKFLKNYKISCGYEGYFSAISSAYFGGFMVGILLGGKLYDLFGRKKCSVIGIFVFCFVVLLHAGSKTDFRVFAVAHTFTGLLNGVIGVIFIYQTELTVVKMRNFGSQIYNEMFSVGMLYGALLSAYIENFAVICIALIAPALLLNLVIAIWLPESPMWLHLHNKHDEFQKSLEYVAKFNGIKYTKDEKVEGLPVTKTTHTATSLFTYSRSTKITTFIFLFTWLSASFCYWGLSFNVGDLIGDLYMNQILICLIDLINRPINYYGVKLTNRVTFLRACNSGMCISAIVCMIPYEKEIFPNFNLTKISALAGRMLADLYFSTVYLYTAEVLPTVVRASGLGMFSSCARLGSILAPFVVVANTYSPNINFSVILFMSTACFVLYRWMPETRDKLLPGTMQEMKDLVEGRVRHALEMRGDIVGLLDSDSEEETRF